MDKAYICSLRAFRLSESLTYALDIVGHGIEYKVRTGKFEPMFLRDAKREIIEYVVPLIRSLIIYDCVDEDGKKLLHNTIKYIEDNILKVEELEELQDMIGRIRKDVLFALRKSGFE